MGATSSAPPPPPPPPTAPLMAPPPKDNCVETYEQFRMLCSKLHNYPRDYPGIYNYSFQKVPVWAENERNDLEPYVRECAATPRPYENAAELRAGMKEAMTLYAELCQKCIGVPNRRLWCEMSFLTGLPDY